MKIKFALILLIITSALAVIGYYGQNTLSKLIQSIQEESRPNYRLNLLQDISSSLLIGENSLNRFSITKIPDDLDNYYNTVSTIDTKIDSFTSLSIQVDQQLQEAIFLNQLIEQKLIVSSELIALKDKENTTIAFVRILHAIQKQENEFKAKPDSIVKEVRSDSLISQNPVLEAETLPELVIMKKPRRENIFKKIFGPKNKKLADIPEQPVVDLPVEILPDSSTVTVTTAATTDKSTEGIKELVTRIGKEERDINRQLSNQELQLLTRDKEISDQLNALIERIKIAEQMNSDKRATSASALTAKTQELINVTIAVALAFICLLFGIVLFDLARLKRKREELGEAKDEAERLARVKQEFLATMSHEIRTPLTAIIGFTEQIEADPTNHNNSDYVEIIAKSSNHLLTIVNDILDYARLEAGSMVIEHRDFQLSGIIEEVVGLFEAQALTKGLELSFDNTPADIYLKGDPFRYKQILINLIGNALKFTNKGAVTVQVKFPDDAKQQFVTLVKDTGIGISKERFEGIFNSFEQADSSTTRDFGGTGLGLSIVKKLVSLLNGSVNVTSKPGEGSEFEIILPFEKIDVVEGMYLSELNQKEAVLSGKHILVVDDEPYNLELNKVILEREDVIVQTADNGPDGLSLIQEEHFDMAILDIQMPGISGHSMAKTIRQWHGPKSSMPLIASTAGTLDKDIELIEQTGFDGWITKPFSRQDLLQKVSEIIDQCSNKLTSEPKTEQLDSLSVDALLDLSQGNTGFVLNMLQLYLKSTEDNFKQLTKAVSDNNLHEIERITHKMVSPTRHLNLTYFMRVLKKMEITASTQTEPHEIQSLFKTASKMWDRIIPLIKMKIEEFQNSQLGVSNEQV